MIIELHTYRCDTCGQHSSPAGFERPEHAWAHAKRIGWLRVEPPTDHSGHVGTLHYCATCAPAQRLQLIAARLFP